MPPAAPDLSPSTKYVIEFLGNAPPELRTQMRKAIALDGGRVELVAPSIKMAVTNRLPDLPGFKKAPAEMTAMIDAVDWEAVAKHIIVTG